MTIQNLKDLRNLKETIYLRLKEHYFEKQFLHSVFSLAYSTCTRTLSRPSSDIVHCLKHLQYLLSVDTTRDLVTIRLHRLMDALNDLTSKCEICNAHLSRPCAPNYVIAQKL